MSALTQAAKMMAVSELSQMAGPEMADPVAMMLARHIEKTGGVRQQAADIQGALNQGAVNTKGLSQYEAMGKRMLRNQYGMGGKQFKAMDWVFDHESGEGWNPKAANPTSSARGIPQAMMSVHFGDNWQNSQAARRFLRRPKKQIDWGMDYMMDRYGSPLAAKKYWQANGYY